MNKYIFCYLFLLLHIVLIVPDAIAQNGGRATHSKSKGRSPVRTMSPGQFQALVQSVVKTVLKESKTNNNTPSREREITALEMRIAGRAPLRLVLGENENILKLNLPAFRQPQKPFVPGSTNAPPQPAGGALEPEVGEPRLGRRSWGRTPPHLAPQQQWRRRPRSRWLQRRRSMSPVTDSRDDDRP